MISVIIPTYRRYDFLKKTLSHIEKQEKKDFEVLVSVDGPDSSQEEEIVDGFRKNFKSLETVSSGNQLGRAGNRNFGASKSRGDLLVFLDDDMAAIPELIKIHSVFHKSHLNSILVGNQIEKEESGDNDFQRFKAFLSRKWTNGVPENQTDPNSLFLTAANVSIPRELFNKLGGFDESLSDCEDYELGLRALKQGVSIHFNSNCIGYHLDKPDCRQFISRQKQYRKEKIKVLEKHGIDKPKYSKMKWKDSFFSSSIFPFMVDKFNLFRILPRSIRFKAYDLIVTSQSYR